ncbi:MAG: single-stranded DNA-binding protein [Lachnospiraceae bacterium]|nr:single-stranded DNA-binding protein [Lachnospiraceae bacterium]
MNKVILIGRLTRDPDVRYTSGEDGVCVARFSLAVDRRYKKDGDAQTADFPSCVAFRKTGEFIEKYAKKGTKLCIEGRLQTGSYTNKDGVKVYTTDVVVENCEFAESKVAAGGSSEEGAPEPTVDSDGFMNIPDGLDDEGLPFN